MEKITARELALKLNCREYGNEITAEEEQQAKENNLLVVFGYSDDCVELRGAIDDEIGSGDIYITKKGNVKRKHKDGRLLIRSGYGRVGWVIGPGGEFPQEFSSNFNIFEDDERFCQGVVIDLNKAFPTSEQ